MNDQNLSKSSEELENPAKPNSLVIYGGGGHGKSMIEVVQSLGTYNIVGVIDDGLPPGSEVLGIPVLGGASELNNLVEKGTHLAINAVGGIGDLETRIGVFQILNESGFEFPSLVHPTAMVEPSARLAPGTQIFPHAYVGTEAEVGFGVIVNTGAIISHDCKIGDYSGLAPGVLLAGEVKIGECVQVGMGVSVNLRLSIGEGSRIGNSAVIKQDVPAKTVVRAGSVWPSQD